MTAHIPPLADFAGGDAPERLRSGSVFTILQRTSHHPLDPFNHRTLTEETFP